MRRNRRLRSFNELSKTISEDSLYDYYISENHDRNATMQYFDITDTELNYLLKGYRLTGKKGQVYSSDKHFDDIMQKATRENVVDYFIAKQHTIDESAAYFGLSRATFRRLLAKYGVKKTQDQAIKTQKRWMIDTYGVENSFQRPEVKEKIKETFKEKYGVEHALQNKDFLNKAIETSVSRYGENFRMLASNDSHPNKEIELKLKARDIAYEREFRIGTRFFDFKIGNYLLEINPTATHNSYWSPYGDHGSKITKNYHKEKRAIGISNGYQVISVFDWMNIDKILDIFFKQKKRIFARDCETKVLQKSDFAKYRLRDFIDRHHLQGWPRYGQQYAICLLYNGELVAAQTWGKARYNAKCEYELYRQVTSVDYVVVGGNEKMFSCFQKTINTEKQPIVSYCDYNAFSGKTYAKLGFELVADPKPTRHWVYFGNKISEMTDRQRHFTDNEIRQHGFDRLVGNIFGCFGKGTSNIELLYRFDYVDVYDCGQATYIWRDADNQNK